MISKKLQDKLNEQINREYFSSYLYLAMSAYCTSISMDGCAAWLRVQAEEELEHALKIFDYLHHQQARVTLAAIAQPQLKVKSVQDVFKQTLAHEKYISKSIHELMLAAQQEKDFASQAFLQWFVTEQVEEEAEAQRIVDRLRMIGDSVNGLLYLDRELGKRQAD